jgi:gas vesicle protein
VNFIKIKTFINILKLTVMSTGKVVLGAVAGLAVGGILGILFAPDKGSNTRKKIIDKSNDATDRLNEKITSIANSLSDKYSSLMSKGKELIEKEAEDIQYKNIRSINKELGS